MTRMIADASDVGKPMRGRKASATPVRDLLYPQSPSLAGAYIM